MKPLSLADHWHLEAAQGWLELGNLELMPLRMNEKKNAKIGDRQRDMAKKFHQAGLLSTKGLDAVLR